LLLLGGVLSWWENGVENVLSVGVREILRIEFGILREGSCTLTCFFPELETRTGLEYLTKLCGWLKLVGPEDICNFCNFKYKHKASQPPSITIQHNLVIGGTRNNDVQAFSSFNYLTDA